MQWIIPILSSVLLCQNATAGATDRIRNLEKQFVAPCCWHEAVAHHGSREAEQMRAKIATLVDEGRSDSEVIDFFVSRFGERILREPRGRKSMWLYTLPGAAAVGGLLLLIQFVNRNLRNKTDE